LRELERIARLGLLEQGRDGEYYVLVADTLRTYIVQRYRIPALERTTYEVQSVLGRAAARAQYDQLITLLAEADGVKFARSTPTLDQAQRLIDRAREAILASR